MLRLLAENYKMRRVVRVVHEVFAEEHGPGSAAECTFGMVRWIKETRQEEIRALREKLRAETSDLWIAQTRQRLIALEKIYEDCNRWVPVRLLEDRRGGTSKVVYAKNVDGMVKCLKQAREELGEDPASRAADSLEDLVRRAEKERGLTATVDAEVIPERSVPVVDDALLIELAGENRSAGADEERGFLDGSVEPPTVELEPNHLGGDDLPD